MPTVSYAKKNEQLARALQTFCTKHKLGDISIYYNERCIRFDSAGKKSILPDVVGSDYFEYANDETVSMSFEGRLHHALNYGTSKTLAKSFDAIFAKHNCYYEFGYAWSLSVYYN